MSMGEAGPSIPGVKHKVIALLSGGKDSCFNLLHCEANGHEVVAIATLTPEEGVDELDSHLYQSVGTRLLPLIARAADLPLHTRVIRGKAVELGPEYGSRSGGIGKGKGKGKEGDETEDLYELLQEVLRAHPDATALSSGAILSNYQRLRIEHVCSRLGLVSLSYLWQQPQLPLLRSMLACGMEVVLVKVAGVGLTDKLVGRQLGQVMPLLTKMEQTYGSHPAGEGGEYETITLSSPLWSHRLVLKSTEVIITDPGEYPVAYLRVDDADIEEKEGWTRPTAQQLRDMLGLPPNARKPLGDSEVDEDELALLGTESAGLDQTSRGIYKQALSAAEARSESSTEAESSLMALQRLRLDSPAPSQQYEKPRARLSRRGRWVVAAIDGHRSSSDGPIESEIKQAFDTLSSALDAKGISLSLHAAHITFLLSSMALFAPANAVYASYFGVSPPSRATVAVPLPRNQRIRLEVVCFDDGPDREHPDSMVGTIGGRQALHVQGLSYWAPANIGPYSQAVVVNSRVHLAGQIPLIPASLTLPEPSPSVSPYPLQSALALQHVRRVLDLLRSKQSTGGGWVGWCETTIAWWATPPDEPAVDGSAIVRAAWAASELAGETPVAFVQAAELPRGALVEYQVDLHTGRPGISAGVDVSAPASGEDDDEDEDEDEDLLPVHSSVVTDDMRWEVCRTSRRGQGSRAMLFAAGPVSGNDAQDTVKAFLDDSAIGIKLYHQDEGTENFNPDELAKHLLPDFLPTPQGATAPCVTLVPVRSIADRTGRRWPFVMEIFGA